MKNSILRWEPDFRSRLFRLAIPIALQSIITASMQIVDNVMIGRLGEIPLAAVTQANRISFLFQIAMFGAISGASIFVAQYWGKRNISGVQKILGMAMVMGLLVAAVLGIPSILMPESIMRIFIKNDEAVKLGAQYLGIMGFVYFVQSQSLVQSAVLKSTEQVKLPMFASIVGILTNLFFNWLLIYDHGSFGGYGVRGGATATLIGASAEFVVIIVFSRRYNFVTVTKFKNLLPNSSKDVKRFLLIALPVLLNESLWAGGMTVYSTIYGQIGDGVAATAAAGILSNIEQIANIAIRALCHACGVMVGMALGANALDKARTYAQRFLVATPIFTQVLALLIILPFGGLIVDIFPVGPETGAMAKDMIYTFSAFAWAHALNCVVIVSLLRTGGDVRAAALIDVLPLWLIGVPCAAIAGIVLKLEMRQVFLITQLEQVAKVAVALWRYRKGKWIQNIVKEN